MIIDQEIMNNIAIKDELDEYCNKYKGRVYYDQKENRFVQIRETITNSPVRDGFVCSDFCEYYDSTKTVTIFQRLDVEYITKHLVAIDLSESRLFYHDGIGLRIKDEE